MSMVIGTNISSLTAQRHLATSKNEMETAFEINVPLIVHIGIGNNWLEAH